jgi:heme a synthase
MHRFTKFCWFVLVWTVLVILWGAYVRASGSGAGCGNHWPLCNGELLPQPKQIETSIEFTHRLLSGGALLLIFAMLIWGWKTSEKGQPVRKGLVASTIFIITEALLGASLVLFGLVTTNQSASRAVVMALHLLNTFFLLASIALTAWWAGGGKTISLKNQGYTPLMLAISLAGIAIVGMSGAITALGDTLFPAESLAHGLEQESIPGAHFLIRLRIYHPLIAILAGAYVLVLVNRLRRNWPDELPRKIGILLSIIILIQWAAGLVNVILLAPVPIQIIHLLIADMAWILLVLFSAEVLSLSTDKHMLVSIPEVD